MRTVIHIWLLLSLLSANNNLDYVFEYFINGIPSDDPIEYKIDSNISYVPRMDTSLYWIVPNKELPADVNTLKSNNNVAIELFENRIFIAFRSSASHFAGSSTKMIVMSSKDGKIWDKEDIIKINQDIREPLFGKIGNRLMFYYFKAGTSSMKFEPTFVYMKERVELGKWSKPQQVSDVGSRVFWSMKNRNNKIYVTSYEGEHYKIFGKSDISVRLLESTDGVNFNEVSTVAQYNGGVSEVAFEFDENGDFWAVSRNEDGDKSGFGSHLIFADKNEIDKWMVPESAIKNIFMSPRMFRHGDDIYLISRRNKGLLPFGFMPEILPMSIQRIFNWLKFTTSAKTTSLYKINRESMGIEYLFDLPGTGDTAFSAIRRLDAHSFLIANYTSDVNNKNRWWFWGQIRPTYIYMTRLTFEAIN